MRGTSAIEVYETAPDDFTPQVEAAACYLEIDDRLLVLQSSPHKATRGLWGVPAGKLESNESPEAAALRELCEETGISIPLSQIRSLGCLYIHKPELSYIYHMFKIDLDQMPQVQLSEEHQDYTWASLQDLSSLPLIAGAYEGLQKYHLAKSFTS